jgi:hypothetical protein
VNGGTSLSAIRMIGQVTPQTIHSTTSNSFAVVSSSVGLATRSGFLTVCSRLLRAGATVPIEYLLASPEQHVLLFADVFDGAAEVFQPMRRAHDVGGTTGAIIRALSPLLAHSGHAGRRQSRQLSWVKRAAALTAPRQLLT